MNKEMLENGRFENESFKDYKLRRNENNVMLHRYLKGKFIHLSKNIYQNKGISFKKEE
jgi:hypothetical protein